MADFHQFLIFFMEFINIGPAYLYKGVGGAWGGVVAKAKAKKQDDTNSRV